MSLIIRMSTRLSNNHIAQYINSRPINAVEVFDASERKIRYSSQINSDRKIDEITGDEEIVRAIILTKLVNDYGYSLDHIHLEKTYEMGRPKVNTPRIDVIVKDGGGNAFMFIELKAPDKFEEDQDNIIENNFSILPVPRMRKVIRLNILFCLLVHWMTITLLTKPLLLTMINSILLSNGKNHEKR